MSEKCTIFAGGEPVSRETLDMSFVSGSTLYAADKGYELAKALGVKCDFVIGDFDSSDKPESGNVLQYPIEKDDTDLMLAIKHAFQNGSRYFQIYGAMGGSADHFFGNIQSLAYINEKGGSGELIGDNDVISILPAGEYSFPYMIGFSLSLFAYSERVEGLCVHGTKYEADDITLDNSFPLGVSNKVTAEEGAAVSFKSGRLLVIRSKR